MFSVVGSTLTRINIVLCWNFLKHLDVNLGLKCKLYLIMKNSNTTLIKISFKPPLPDSCCQILMSFTKERPESRFFCSITTNWIYFTLCTESFVSVWQWHIYNFTLCFLCQIIRKAFKRWKFLLWCPVSLLLEFGLFISVPQQWATALLTLLKSSPFCSLCWQVGKHFALKY